VIADHRWLLKVENAARIRDNGVVIDDGYRDAATLIKQLQENLDAIKAAQPGSETHRKAITAYTATYARLGRSPYTKHAPYPLPPDMAFEA
jgi:hypothetical protein